MKRELVIIGCYLDNDLKKDIIRNLISILKDRFDIMLVSHYPIDLDIQQSVNYVIYDYKNELKDDIGFYEWYGNDDLYYERHFDKSINHSYSVYTSIRNGIYSAKGLGYDYFFYIEGDLLIDSRDIIKLFELRDKTIKENKSAYFFNSYEDYWECQLFYCNVDFLIENTPIIFDFNHFNQICEELDCKIAIEYMYYNLLYKKHTSRVGILSTRLLDYMPNSKFNATSVIFDIKDNYKITDINVRYFDKIEVNYLILLLRMQHTKKIYLLFHNRCDKTLNVDVYVNGNLTINTNKYDSAIIYKEMNFVDDIISLEIKENGNVIGDRKLTKMDILNSKDFIKFHR